MSSVGEDGEPDFGGVPIRHVPALMERLHELIEADRRTLEAQRAIIAGTAEQPSARSSAVPAKGDTLAGLMALWEAHRKPSPRTRVEARTAVARFERVNGPLPYAAVTDEHARRFKADLLGDAGLKNATRQKLWGMLRALLNTAVDDRLLDANPFARVKLRLDDDSAARETLTQQDLAALFAALADGEEWWIARIGLYTGARLGEICQLTKADLVTVEGVPCLHIREDAEAGKRVKNRGSVRKVPLHRQLVADGILEWIAAREGDALFTVGSHAASKRLNRRMRAAGLGGGKVFHSLRHTFKSAARRCMDAEWHDRLTGHSHRTVGETYGDYDLRTLKEKMDRVAFGVET